MLIDFRKAATTTEAADLLGLSASTLEKWRSERKGPAYFKIGGKIFYRVEDLEQYQTSRLRNPENLPEAPSAA
jgi:excisionase family DNA binding protein